MKRIGRRRLALLVFLGVLLVIIAAIVPFGLTRRVARVDARAEQYAGELRAESSSFRSIEVSPDGRYAAVSPRVVASLSTYVFRRLTDTLPAWVLSTYSTVTVLDSWGGDVRPVVSIGESSYHSGISHKFRWSADGRALLVTGAGRLNASASETLCLVYLVDEDALIRPASCP